METVYKYRYTTTSGGNHFYYQLLEANLDPQVHLIAPDGSSVVSGSVTVVDTLDSTVTKVDLVKEWVSTNEHFGTETIDCLDVPPSGVSYSDHIFKVNHSIMGGQVLFEDVVSPYDYIEAWLGEKTWADANAEGPIGTTVGVLTSGVVSGATTFNVSNDVLENVNAGHQISLIDALDPLNVKHAIDVLSVDLENKTITICPSCAPVTEFGANTTYVRRDDKLIKHFTLLGSGPVPLGYSIEKGSHVPAMYVLRIKYTNTHNVPRSAAVVLEYLF